MTLLYNTIRDGFNRVRGAVSGSASGGRIAIQANAPIDWAREGPFLQEQMRVYAGGQYYARKLGKFTDNFSGETPDMKIKYRYALAEPTVKAALLGKVISVCSLNLQMTPKDENSSFAHDVAACTRHALASGPRRIPGLLWEILIGGVIDGWSVSEKIWGLEERGQYRGRRILANLKGKDTWYIYPEVDEFRNVIALWNYRGNAGRSFDPKKFVLFSYLSIFQNPLGISDLRASYRAIELIPTLINLRMIFLEKYAGPYLVGKIKDRALKSKMLAELKQARGKGVLVIDESSDVEVIDLATRGTSDFQSGLEDLRQEVAIGISGAFLHMLTGMNPEARGSSAIQQDTTESFTWILSEDATAVIDRQLVPDIVDHNHGSMVDLPDTALEAVNPDDILKDLQIDKLLHDMGLGLSKEATLKRARRVGPKDDKDIVPGASSMQSVTNDLQARADAVGLGQQFRAFAEQLNAAVASRAAGKTMIAV